MHHLCDEHKIIFSYADKLPEELRDVIKRISKCTNLNDLLDCCIDNFELITDFIDDRDDLCKALQIIKYKRGIMPTSIGALLQNIQIEGKKYSSVQLAEIKRSLSHIA